jgi:hypothetical protein
VGNWSGPEPGLGGDWLKPVVAGVQPASQPAARLALLAALSPHQAVDDVITAFSSLYPGDERLLGATAWASFTAARRIGSWLGSEAVYRESICGPA